MKLQNNALVVIATGTQAKLFVVKDDRLTKHSEWSPADLLDSGPSGKLPPEVSDTEKDEATFSKQIAHRLYSMAHDNAFDRLVLIADPGTLGEVRPQLHHEVLDKIVLEIDKTLVNSTIEDIEKIIENEMEN